MMRTIFVPPLGHEFSALGFGCASLGSRIPAKQGQSALALAFERGITWYDVAPPYGDGNAEALLGSFLAGRRDRVAICTKAGIPRVTPSFAKRMVRPAMRLALKVVPQLRKNIAPLRQNVKTIMPLDEIEKSVIDSLRLLRTDYIDVLALHEPALALCQDPALFELLESFIKKGYVRCVSIAGSLEAVIAGSAASPLFQFAQFQDNPFLNAGDQLQQNPALQNHFLISHSVFGSGALERFTEACQKSPVPLSERPSDLLFDYSLAKNAKGIVLSSMFSQRHIENNCARASAPIDQDAIARVHTLIAQQP